MEMESESKITKNIDKVKLISIGLIENDKISIGDIVDKFDSVIRLSLGSFNWVIDLKNQQNISLKCRNVIMRWFEKNESFLIDNVNQLIIVGAFPWMKIVINGMLIQHSPKIPIYFVEDRDKAYKMIEQRINLKTIQNE